MCSVLDIYWSPGYAFVGTVPLVVSAGILVDFVKGFVLVMNVCDISQSIGSRLVQSQE